MPCKFKSRPNWRDYCICCGNYTRIGTGCLLDEQPPESMRINPINNIFTNRKRFANDPTAMEASKGATPRKGRKKPKEKQS